MPCTDVPQIELNATDNVAETENNHDHSSSGEDDCSPFCICLCCGSIIAMPTGFEVNTGRIEWTALRQSHYTFDYSFDYIEGIWHPPALS